MGGGWWSHWRDSGKRIVEPRRDSGGALRSLGEIVGKGSWSHWRYSGKRMVEPSERFWEEDGGASKRFWEEDGGAIQACSEGLSIATPLDLSPNSGSIAERCQPVVADVPFASSGWYRSAIEEGFISSRGESLRSTPRYRLVSLRDELEHFN